MTVRNNCIFCKIIQGLEIVLKNTVRTKTLCFLLPLSANKIKKMSSFKSNENIQKKEKVGHTT